MLFGFSVSGAVLGYHDWLVLFVLLGTDYPCSRIGSLVVVPIGIGWPLLMFSFPVMIPIAWLFAYVVLFFVDGSMMLIIVPLSSSGLGMPGRLFGSHSVSGSSWMAIDL